MEGGEKAFHPSKRKLEKTKRDGILLRSPLLNGFLGMISGFIVGSFASVLIWERSKKLVQYIIEEGFLGVSDIGIEVLKQGGVLCGGIVAGIVIMSLTGEIMISKPMINISALFPQFKRINPASGLKNMAKGVFQIPELLLRCVLVLGSVAYLLFVVIHRLIVLSYGFPESRILGMISLVEMFVISIVFVIGIIGFIEFLIKRHQYNKQVFMSYQEVREENKEEEGDPLFKSFRRAEHEDLLMQDLVKRVRESKVIVVERE